MSAGVVMGDVRWTTKAGSPRPHSQSEAIPSDVVDIESLRAPITDLRVAIIGSGAYATAMASLLTNRNSGEAIQNVTMYCRNPDISNAINNEHRNPKPELPIELQNLKLSQSVRATSNLDRAMRDSDVVLLAIPSAQLPAELHKLSFPDRAGIVSLMKGFIIDENSDEGPLTPLQYIARYHNQRNPTAFLGGPGFAKDIVNAEGVVRLIAASETRQLALDLHHLFSWNKTRVFTHDDPHALEVCGAIKNLVAFAMGLTEGLEFSQGERARVFEEGFKLMTQLVPIYSRAQKIGAARATAGHADLALTATGESRNLKLGKLIATNAPDGIDVERFANEKRLTAEGIGATRGAARIAQRLELHAPLISAMKSVVDGAPARVAFERFFTEIGEATQTSCGDTMPNKEEVDYLQMDTLLVAGVMRGLCDSLEMYPHEKALVFNQCLREMRRMFKEMGGSFRKLIDGHFHSKLFQTFYDSAESSELRGAISLGRAIGSGQAVESLSSAHALMRSDVLIAAQNLVGRMRTLCGDERSSSSLCPVAAMTLGILAGGDRPLESVRTLLKGQIGQVHEHRGRIRELSRMPAEVATPGRTQPSAIESLS